MLVRGRLRILNNIGDVNIAQNKRRTCAWRLVLVDADPKILSECLVEDWSMK